MNLLSPDPLYSHYLLELYLQKLSTILLPHPFSYPPKLLMPQRTLNMGMGLGSLGMGIGAGVDLGVGVGVGVGVKKEEGVLKREEGEEGNRRLVDEGWRVAEGGSGRTMGTVVEDAHLYIGKILKFLVKNVGKNKSGKVKAEGEKIFEGIDSLKEVFDGLLSKFLVSVKTKEEKIKYVLRKSFKFMKEKLMEEKGIAKSQENESFIKKKIERMFLDHYFSGRNQEELSAEESNNIKDMIMPFRKNSKNKTMNSEFLKKIFSFDKFYNDYLLFLDKFKELSEFDNEEKIVKTSKKISELMPTKNYKEFSQKYFKRMPWLDVWVNEAELIARKLHEFHSTTTAKTANSDAHNDSINGGDCVKKIKIEAVTIGKRSRANSI